MIKKIWDKEIYYKYKAGKNKICLLLFCGQEQDLYVYLFNKTIKSLI